MQRANEPAVPVRREWKAGRQAPDLWLRVSAVLHSVDQQRPGQTWAPELQSHVKSSSVSLIAPGALHLSIPLDAAQPGEEQTLTVLASWTKHNSTPTLQEAEKNLQNAILVVKQIGESSE